MGEKKELETIDIHRKILLLKNEIETKFLKLGAYLKLVNERKLYIEKGCQTFNEYLAQPELSFQRSMAYSLIGVYEDFAEGKLSESLDTRNIPYYKLDRIRQFKNDDDIGEWVEKARELSLSDLNISIKEARGTLEDRDPRLKDVPHRERGVENIMCPYCGKTFQWQK